MRRVWLWGVAMAVVAGAAFVFFTERPLAVTVVQSERDVALRIYGLGTVEARILSRVGFEVGAALTSLVADAGDIVVRGQELAALHATEQEVRVARARAAVRRSGWPSSAHWPTVAASSWPMSLLRKLAVEQEACIVTVTHDEKIFDRFDRLIHLRDGRLTDA